MRKLVLTFAFAIMSIVAFAQSQYYEYNDFFARNNNVSINLQFGAVDNINNKHAGFQTMMFGISAYGVYMDIGGWPASHTSDYFYGDRDDEKCFAIHGGYQIPVLPFLKITPLLGYYEHQIGWTDGDWYYIDRYGDIHNHFITEYEYRGFDYGAQIQFDIYRLSIVGTVTKNMWYAGLGVNIPL